LTRQGLSGEVFQTFRAALFFYFFAFLVLTGLPLRADDGGASWPRISRLDTRDEVFKQYLQDVEDSRRRLFTGRGSPEEIAEYFTVYSYIPSETDDILGLAARCNIPYSALATLNRLSHPGDLLPGKVLLLPSAPGLFIPDRPVSDLEKLLVSSREEAGETIPGFTVTAGARFRFLPGEDLSPTERAFFLNRSFRFPLAQFQVSSAYGPRINPVTGRYGVHKGVDLAAPEGADVYAARDGTVSEQGEDPVFGNYIIISHGDNWVSLYGHLSKIETTLFQAVQYGNLIGRVGSTGQSTGPHLHFELRQNGMARDPGRLLGLFR
jgi:murein DD-endopeptidase MepM/ murein hydrolase activator NlpD